jgi:tetratricopeptide (TPR) repeat protein
MDMKMKQFCILAIFVVLAAAVSAQQGNNADAFVFRGHYYHINKDYDNAILCYTQALMLDPNDALTYESRAGTYAKKGDYDRAIEVYTLLLRLDPNNLEAYDKRGASYYLRKTDPTKEDLVHACADWEKSLQINPGNRDVRVLLGAAQEMLKRQ